LGILWGIWGQKHADHPVWWQHSLAGATPHHWGMKTGGHPQTISEDHGIHPAIQHQLQGLKTVWGLCHPNQERGWEIEPQLLFGGTQNQERGWEIEPQLLFGGSQNQERGLEIEPQLLFGAGLHNQERG
jgi:hypothetical protein